MKRKIKLIDWVSSQNVWIYASNEYWAQWGKKNPNTFKAHMNLIRKKREIYSKIPNEMRALNLKESSKIKCVILLPFWRVKATSSRLYTEMIGAVFLSFVLRIMFRFHGFSFSFASATIYSTFEIDIKRRIIWQRNEIEQELNRKRRNKLQTIFFFL